MQDMQGNHIKLNTALSSSLNIPKSRCPDGSACVEVAETSIRKLLAIADFHQTGLQTPQTYVVLL